MGKSNENTQKPVHELFHPEIREKYINQIGETISLLLEILDCNEDLVVEYGEPAIRSMAMLDSIRRDIRNIEINQ